MKQNNIFRR